MFKIINSKSVFVRNILTLVTGTTIAQVIPIAFSPVLTRIYEPEDFGLFGIYSATTSIIAVIATGRYEMALMLPKKEEQKKVNSLVKLILILLTITSLFVLLIVTFFNDYICSLFKLNGISNWLYFVPISVFLVGIYQVYNYLLIREKVFNNLSLNKVIVSISNTSFQLLYFLFSHNGMGMLFGNIFSYIISIAVIIKSGVVNFYFKTKNLTIRDVAIEFQNFPKYDVPAVLTNVLANQIPIFTIGKYFGLGVAGFYSFMYKVLMLPIGLLSNTILDVFKQRATEDFNKFGNCKEIYLKTLKALILIGVIPFTIIGFFAPQIFSFIFGEKWKIAGEFAQLMTPMFFLNFIVNPLSYIFIIAQKQIINLCGQILLFILSVISIYIGVYYKSEYITVVAFSFSYSVIYILYLIISFVFSLGNYRV